MATLDFIRPFSDLGLEDLQQVGGKNASLGEMIRALGGLGVRVPDGFAVTAGGYRRFLEDNELTGPIRDVLAAVDLEDVDDLRARSRRIRNLMIAAPLPGQLIAEIEQAYAGLAAAAGVSEPFVAVRSSATAEDLPTASFAGQQETYLNVHGATELVDAVRRCFASLFTARAISYRQQRGFEHMAVALSVGVQQMVRADRGSAGVMFTLDTETGFRDVVLISSAWGFGESVVSGRVSPDEIYIHKPTLETGHRLVLWRKLGAKETRVIWDGGDNRLRTVPTPPEMRAALSLSDDDALVLARWAIAVERHYSEVRGEPTPMDLEWARSDTGELFIVQARPETVHSQKGAASLVSYALSEHGETLVEGTAVGEAIAVGRAHLIPAVADISRFAPGEVLITSVTDPDWEPVMKSASAIVTERGGRTSHAAIVAREIGIPAIVGAGDALAAVPDGSEVTVSCAEGVIGRVYRGALRFERTEIDLSDLPATRTKIMLNVAQPESAFRAARLPSDGVGLARMEFVFAGWVGAHPLALTRFDSLDAATRREVDERTGGAPDKTAYFVDRLSQGIATLAAAFYPRPVIVRFSDFKSNEYAHLAGGAGFEPSEPNPMIGWRGASRYVHPEFKEGFLLEVEAIKRVRQTMGLTNLAVMVPFCRTPEEGAAVLEVVAEGGLVRGQDGLEVYVMAEIPSNVFLAERFAEIFDGFSIGTNDLTQLILGVDRDSERIAHLFDERNEAVKRACAMLIESAHRAGRTVGICGQAPSDYPEFAAFLVERGIDSISLSPDALVATRRRIAEVERGLRR
jgi:pyruvate,water dikinase